MTRRISGGERMALNAAMDKLISETEEGWLEAAQLVVDYGRTIGSTTDILRTVNLVRQDGDVASGHAAGIGDVTIKSSDEKLEGEERIRIGIIERIGHFKIVHRAESCCVEFWDYRDDLLWDRQLQVPEYRTTYAIHYTPEGLPCTFARAIFEHRITWRDIPAFVMTCLRAWKISMQQFMRTGKRPITVVCFNRMRHIGFHIIHSTLPDIASGSFIFRPGVLARLMRKQKK